MIEQNRQSGRERQIEKILFIFPDYFQQAGIVARVGFRAMHKVGIAQHVHQQMPFDAVRRFGPTLTFGFELGRVGVLGTHRISN